MSILGGHDLHDCMDAILERRDQFPQCAPTAVEIAANHTPR